MSLIEAAIFDFDGTLVDTMPLHYEAYRRTFQELNLELTEADFYNNIGGKACETIPRFLRGRACSWTTEQIHQRKKELISELLSTAPLKVLAAAELLPLLHGRLHIAVASSGSRCGIESVIQRLGWQQYFSAVVAGEDTPRGKPAPDLFLLAAERLGVAPAKCIVFEDTDDGVAAARTAEMAVFDVRCAAAPSSALTRNDAPRS